MSRDHDPAKSGRLPKEDIIDRGVSEFGDLLGELLARTPSAAGAVLSDGGDECRANSSSLRLVRSSVREPALTAGGATQASRQLPVLRNLVVQGIIAMHIFIQPLHDVGQYTHIHHVGLLAVPFLELFDLSEVFRFADTFVLSST